MRILIADDSHDIRNLVKEVLQSEGYEVITARDGLEALQQAAHFHPDALIVDISMPGIEGWEVCRRIKAERNIPVMILSVRKEKEDIARGFALGADEYLSKPFDLSTFLSRLEAMLERGATS